MRKYFLISAVALLTATNVNAATESADVTVTGEVILTTKVSCTDLNFGTIYFDNTSEGYVTVGSSEYDITTSGGAVKVVGAEPAMCSGSIYMTEDYEVILPDKIWLDFGNDATNAFISEFYNHSGWIGAKLTIPSDLETGAQFTTSFPILMIQ